MSAPSTVFSGLRPYQIDWQTRIQRAYAAGHRRVLGQMPTAAGKTAVCANILHRSATHGHHGLFLAQLEEIVLDTADRFTKALAGSGMSVGIILGDHPRTPSATIQVATVQSMCALIERIEKGSNEQLPHARRIIVDEAHHAGADSYTDVIDQPVYADALVLGVTATPIRDATSGKGVGLGDVFTALVLGPSVSELTEQGYLAHVEVISPPMTLERGLSMHPLEAWCRYGRNRPTLIFAANRAHAKAIADAFIADGIATEILTAHTPTTQRRGVRERLARSITLVAVVVDAPWEGFDAPAIKCVMFARPVGSIKRWFQGIGRGMRMSCPVPCAPGENELLTVVDLCGSYYHHGLVTDAVDYSLTEGMKRSSAGVPSLRRCSSCSAIFVPAARCPRCGSANVVDPRPMRIQRAEMYAVSELPASTRAKQYLASLVRTAEKARVPEHKRAAWALKKAPQWVRDALSEAPQEKQRVDAQSSNTSGLFDRREERT